MSSSFPNKSGAINTNALSPFEALGQSVSKGQIIGLVGSTGHSTGKVVVTV